MTATEVIANTRPASDRDGQVRAACSQACIGEGAAATLVTRWRRATCACACWRRPHRRQTMNLALRRPK